jgi:hypothetical protein
MFNASIYHEPSRADWGGPDMAQSTLTGLTALAALLSAVISSVTLIVMVVAGLRNKRTDVLMECHRRFDTLMAGRAAFLKKLTSSSPLDKGTQLEIDGWSHRFWSLQFDEYEWWQHGHVDTKKYCYWMLSRYREFSEGKRGAPFEKIVFVDGWAEVQHRWASPYQGSSPDRPDFLEFVTKIKDCASPANVPGVVQQYRPKGLRRIGLALE